MDLETPNILTMLLFSHVFHLDQCLVEPSIKAPFWSLSNDDDDGDDDA